MSHLKQLGEEGHIYNANGELEGLYTIDGAKARQEFGDKRFWEGIDEIVRLYTRINPSEMNYAAVENTTIRNQSKNEFNSNDSGSFREALNIPHGLYLALTDYERTLFRSKKTRREFMRRFPALRSCETV